MKVAQQTQKFLGGSNPIWATASGNIKNWIQNLTQKSFNNIVINQLYA